MKIVVFDTETTGLPNSRYISPTTLSQWPHIVQLSYAVYDLDTHTLSKTGDFIIQLDKHVFIPPESVQFHGITNEISREAGVPLYDVLSKLFHYMDRAECIVGHNIEFDINMLKVELMRMILDPNITKNRMKDCKHKLSKLNNGWKNIVCTMKETVELCNMKAINRMGNTYLKYPKLVELSDVMFGTIPNCLHNSLNDVLVTLRCYVKYRFEVDPYFQCERFNRLANAIQLFG